MPSIKIVKEINVIVEACPFCRSETTSYDVVNMSGGRRQVICHNCGATGSVKDTEEDAVNAWNNVARLKEEDIKQAVTTAVEETTQQLNNEIKGALLGQAEAPSGL